MSARANDAAVAELTRQGRSVREIAEALGVSTRTIHRARVRSGMVIGNHRADDESIAELTRQGKPARQIAERLGITARTVVRSRARMGVSRATGRKPQRYTQEFLDLASARLDEGWSYAEIGRTYRVDPHRLAIRLPGRGWTKDQASELGALRRAEHRLFRTHADQRRGVTHQASVAEALCRSGAANGTTASQPHTEAPSDAHSASQRFAA